MNFGPLKRWYARLTLGGAAMAALIVMLASTEDWPLDVGASLAFVAAFLAWAFSEFPDRQAHPHDVNLQTLYDAHFTPELRRVLTEYDFGDPIPSAPIMRLYDFADNWTGAAHEFEDPALKKACDAVHTSARTLANLIVVNTWPMRAAPDQISVKTDDDLRTGQRSERTLRVTREMNAGAIDLMEKVEAFDRLARKRLRCS